MTLPTFLVVGAQKAGTTSFHSYLASHPEISMSGRKELDFFSRQWSLGTKWYESCFECKPGARALGETSPSYAAFPMYPGVPARIRRVIPEVRVVYLLRHPVERMVSSYLHALSTGTETRTVRDALLAGAWYQHVSCYALQLELYLEQFPASQLLVLRSEDLRRRPADVLRRAFDFLGVDPDWQPGELHRNDHATERKRIPRPSARTIGQALVWTQVRVLRRPYYPDPRAGWLERYVTRPATDQDGSLDAETAAVLTRLLRPDLVRLRSILGEEFDTWGLI